MDLSAVDTNLGCENLPGDEEIKSLSDEEEVKHIVMNIFFYVYLFLINNNIYIYLLQIMHMKLSRNI